MDAGLGKARRAGHFHASVGHSRLVGRRQELHLGVGESVFVYSRWASSASPMRLPIPGADRTICAVEQIWPRPRGQFDVPILEVRALREENLLREDPAFLPHERIHSGKDFPLRHRGAIEVAGAGHVS